MSAQESSWSLSKWQIAALIGVPVASACVLGGFYYWKTSKASSEGDVEGGETGTAEDETAESKDTNEENRVCSQNEMQSVYLQLACDVTCLTHPSQGAQPTLRERGGITLQ